MRTSASWQSLKDTLWDWVSTPTVRTFSGAVNPQGRHIAVGEQYLPEASYFGIRLVEMYLAEGRRYFTEFLPLGICIAEYTIGFDRQRKPLILGNDMIQSMLSGAGGHPGLVVFNDMYVVRRAPVKDDNASLFVGLFRVPNGDLARQLLQIAADVTEQAGVTAISAGARVAEKVYDRVTGLFKLKDVVPRFGYLEGDALTNSGYVVVTGAPINRVDVGSLSVMDERLHVIEKGRPRVAEGFDYCLLALEHSSSVFDHGLDSINSLTRLPFHRHWHEIVKFLAQKDTTKAEAELLNLRAEVVVSPDLTEADRLLAIAAYDAAYEKYFSILLKAPRQDIGTRSGRSGDPIGGLRSEAARQESYGRPDVAHVLKQIVTRVQLIDPAGPPDPNMPDLVFSREAASLRQALDAQKISQPHIAAQVAYAISVARSRE